MTGESLSLYRWLNSKNSKYACTACIVWLLAAAILILFIAPKATLAQGNISPGGTGTVATEVLNGNQVFNGSTYLLDLDAESTTQTSDLLIINGKLEFGSTLNNIQLADWQDGVFSIIYASDGIAPVENHFNDITVGGNALTNRQWAVIGLNEAGDTLRIHTKTLNLNLVWKGSGNGVWDAAQTNTNWYMYDTVDSEYFMQEDYVIFGPNSASGETITIGEAVTVSGMLVDGGNYYFTGSSISSVVPTKDNHQRETEKLEVTGGASVVFGNTVYFGAGMSISKDSEVLIKRSASENGAFSSKNTAVIDNEGLLYFSADGGTTINHSTVINGSGDVWVVNGNGTLSLSGQHTSTGTLNHYSGNVTMNNDFVWGGNYDQSYMGYLTAVNATIKGNARFNGDVYLNRDLNIDGNLYLNNSNIIWNHDNESDISVLTVQGNVTLEGLNNIGLTFRWYVKGASERIEYLLLTSNNIIRGCIRLANMLS